MADTSNLDQLLTQDIFKPINEDVVNSILSEPPFVSVPRTFNTRTLKSEAIRPDYVYRSGTLEALNTSGIEKLQELRIKKLFDLRSSREVTAKPMPADIQVIWKPSTVDNPTMQTNVAEGKDVHAMYLDLLHSHKEIYRAVFKHILTSPNDPFLFFCTAGKDRTGVLAILILALAGTDKAEIQRDYTYSRIGTEPVREFLMAKLTTGGRGQLDFEDPVVKAASQFPVDVVEELLGNLDGGVKGYVKSLGFQDEEVEEMVQNLRGDDEINAQKEAESQQST